MLGEKTIEYHVRALSHDETHVIEFIFPSKYTIAREARKELNGQKEWFDIVLIISIKKAYFQPGENMFEELTILEEDI